MCSRRTGPRSEQRKDSCVDINIFLIQSQMWKEIFLFSALPAGRRAVVGPGYGNIC